MLETRIPGWDWVARCRVLDGVASRELFDEIVEAGEAAVPLLVDILGRPEWRDGNQPDLSEVAATALRALGEIRSDGALPALLGVLADPIDHSLHGTEAALALARWGEAAFGPVERMLGDRSRDPWARVRAARVFMYAALRDRRLRYRVREIYERFLRDPQERDKLVVSNVIDCGCRLAMAMLIPAIQDAVLAGRADPDWGTLLDFELDLATRRYRPDHETKTLARRAARAAHEPLERRIARLDDAEFVATLRQRLADAASVTEPPDDDEELPPQRGPWDPGAAPDPRH